MIKIGQFFSQLLGITRSVPTLDIEKSQVALAERESLQEEVNDRFRGNFDKEEIVSFVEEKMVERTNRIRSKLEESAITNIHYLNDLQMPTVVRLDDVLSILE